MRVMCWGFLLNLKLRMMVVVAVAGLLGVYLQTTGDILHVAVHTGLLLVFVKLYAISNL